MDKPPITYISEERSITTCTHCGFINDYISLKPGDASDCHRCGHQLYSERKNWETNVIALTLAGIILFVCSNTFPFLGLEVGFKEQSSTLLSGVTILYQTEHYLLSLLIFLTIFLFPLAELSALAYVMINKRMKKRLPGCSVCLHFLFHARPWNMLDIFLIGVIVTSVKLGETATLVPGFGLLAFTLLVIVLIFINLQISQIHLWRWFKKENIFFLADDRKFYDCTACHAIIGQKLWQSHQNCPRCQYHIEPRIKYSVQKTTALLIAAIALYIPAMTLPIMSITSFGSTTQDTVISGVTHLLQEGMWVISSIVFIASVIVPVTKLITMSYLVWSVHQQHRTQKKFRHRLYRLNEFIGRWSMIDVFVITLQRLSY